MFDIMQPTHLLLVLLVALLVLGPKRLPEAGRAVGNGLRDFRAAINGETSHERLDPPEPVVAPDEEIDGPPEPEARQFASTDPVAPATADFMEDEEEDDDRSFGPLAVEAPPAADDIPPRLTVARNDATQEPQRPAVGPAA